MSKINWENVEKLYVSNALWGTTYTPNTYVQLVYKRNEALYIHAFVEELNPKAIYTKANDKVYKDSCIESFINCNPSNSDKYMNFEVNANGAMLCEVGKTRYEREFVKQTFKPIAYKNKMGWGYVLKVPEEVLKEHYETIETTWKANFYKCGDDCDEEHYLSWSLIDSEEMNFHKTEFFKEIKVG